jgi:hypothetical protein
MCSFTLLIWRPYSTAVVEAAKDNSRKSGVATIYFYCDSAQCTMLNGSALLASFIKQLLVYLDAMCKPCPLAVQGDIGKFFGMKRSEPDFEDLADIFSSLCAYTPKAIYILDGLDEFDEKEVEKVLRVVRQLFGGKSNRHGSRILIFSRDKVALHLDVGRSVPGTVHISTSNNITNDIQQYIDTVTEEKKTYVRELTSDPALMEETKQKLSDGALGMYVL